MTIPHVLLMFVGGPALVLVLCYLLAHVTTRNTESAKRYKLGQDWDRGTLWFVGHPKEGVSAHRPLQAIDAADSEIPATTMVGGASGTW